MMCVFTKRRRGKKPIHKGRTPCYDKGKVGSTTTASQNMPKISSKPPEAKKRKGRIVPYRFQGLC